MVIRKRRTGQTIRRVIGCEARAFFLLISMLAGAATFCLIVGQTWDLTLNDWLWLAIAAALLGLPQEFEKLKDSQEPWLVRFARAYRHGFLSISLITPDLSNWLTKAHQLWRIWGQKPKIS
jgi:hypothetical protein